MIKLTESDVAYIKLNWPHLTYDDGENILKGTLVFSMVYDPDSEAYTINPAAPERTAKYFIEDAYEITVDFNIAEHSKLPILKETGGRLKLVQEQKNILDIRDLHVNPHDESLCMLVRPTELSLVESSFKLLEFMNKLVIPFFYAQSYFEKYSQWPWGDYSHGTLGILERYVDETLHTEQVTRFYLISLTERSDWATIKGLKSNRDHKIKGHTPCPCNSGKKFRDCHNKALIGLKMLLGDFKRLNMHV